MNGQTKIAVTRKLIEVALPLDVINSASAREGYIYRGNPSAVHKWWAQRPLATARAVLFAQMVDDPSSDPRFETEEAQDNERQRLFRLIHELVIWENANNEELLAAARSEMQRSWRATCEQNASHPQAAELFDPNKLPVFFDPFCGGGTLPLEAQRLGLEIYGSDLNPVAVLVTKAVTEFPVRFRDWQAVHPQAVSEASMLPGTGNGCGALGADVYAYGQWMRTEAVKRVGHFFPEAVVTEKAADGRPELKSLVGRALPVIACIWARTVRSPNPAFADLDVPLTSTFMLSSKPGKEVYVRPMVVGKQYHFAVKSGKPADIKAVSSGTKLQGANFRCLLSGDAITPTYIRGEAKSGRMGARLMAVVAAADGKRIYLPASEELEATALSARPVWAPDLEFFSGALGFRVGNYGMSKWSDIFTKRQLLVLTTLSDLIGEVRIKVRSDAISRRGNDQDKRGLEDGGSGATAYAEAVATLLAFAVDKAASYGCSLVPWYVKEDRPSFLFARQTISMVWDYAEINLLGDIGGSFAASLKIIANALNGCYPAGIMPHISQRDAVSQAGISNVIVSTDPPYYDNVGYADLSDFFYVWLRHSLKDTFPKLFSTVATPKMEELVATPNRHGGKENAEAFFLEKMTSAMHGVSARSHPAFPITIYYAFRQSEHDDVEGVTSTGWETFLGAVMSAGLAITGTWPVRTERQNRSRNQKSNALASSILMVCRPRPANAIAVTRRQFLDTLRSELPIALSRLQKGNIAPVDLSQAALGPGMAIFTSYANVLNAEGAPLTVRDALALINEVLDEVLAAQEGDFDAETRFAISWFEQVGFDDAEFGLADVLARAKNTSVGGLADAGISISRGGKVRLLRPSELSEKWDPAADSRLTTWEIVHHIIRVLESDGEPAAGKLISRIGSKADIARELAYRLYTIAERRKHTAEALSYNGLVQSWPEILRLSKNLSPEPPIQTDLLGAL